METPAVPLTIEFGRSTSASFAAAVRMASELPGYTCSGSGKSEQHTIKLELSVEVSSE